MSYFVIVLILAFSVIIHECAHGYIALIKGDPTAKRMGRLTLNPIPHIDILGTIILPIFTVFFGNFIFAYAKPVPVNPMYFGKPRKDMMLVALAGPMSNILLAVLGAIPLRLILKGWIEMNPASVVAFHYLVDINIILALINLIPIPPLDGSRIVKGFISSTAAEKLDKIEPYGFPILILLMYLNFFGLVLIPLFKVVRAIILGT